jgi:hypothetical protein
MGWQMRLCHMMMMKVVSTVLISGSCASALEYYEDGISLIRSNAPHSSSYIHDTPLYDYMFTCSLHYWLSNVARDQDMITT